MHSQHEKQCKMQCYFVHHVKMHCIRALSPQQGSSKFALRQLHSALHKLTEGYGNIDKDWDEYNKGTNRLFMRKVEQ